MHIYDRCDCKTDENILKNQFLISDVMCKMF